MSIKFKLFNNLILVLNFSININQLTSIIEITPMNVECRLLYKFQGGQFS